MPKAEKGTPKDIANRIKAKGLQRLRFYCQMCEKQCRDANGFKCHMTSENHLRMMKVFSENAKGIMDRYSREFESSYLTTLRQRHTTKRVNANNVYQEVIQDKQHIHMNATKWATLSDFVMYLGKTGRCVVEETERGWYIQYVEQNAAVLARKLAQEQRAEAEKTAEVAQAEQMERQRMEAAKMLDRAGGVVHLEATKMERNEDDKIISVALNIASTHPKKKKSVSNASKLDFFSADADGEEESGAKPPQLQAPRKPLVANIPNASFNSKKRPTMDSQNDSKRSRNSDDMLNTKITKTSGDDGMLNTKITSTSGDDGDEEEPWLKRDIIVRIVNKTLMDGKYFRRKAIVDEVLKDNKFGAEVAVLDEVGNETGDILRLDQNDLETVIPKEGRKVRILKGKHRGKKAKLILADKKKYRATLKLVDNDELLEKVDFENFSQLS